jgi:hypothetical protein
MARHRTGVLHHVGTFLLFAAAILLLITTITAPVVKDFPMLKVMLTNFTEIRNSSVTFGTFGHCILDVPPIQTDQDYCFPKTIGYNPASIMAQIDGTGFSTASGDTANALTRVMILHPIACALAFIAFLLAIGSGCVGALLASLVSAVTFIITLVVMATDFAAFGIIKNAVNNDGTGSHASYGLGMWTLLAAMIILFFATFIVLFSCFTARRSNRVSKVDGGYANGATTTQRRFWPRRTRY